MSSQDERQDVGQRTGHEVIKVASVKRRYDATHTYPPYTHFLEVALVNVRWYMNGLVALGAIPKNLHQTNLLLDP